MGTHTPPMDRLTRLLDQGPILFDGAMGTELYARGAEQGRALEELNLTDPSLVGAVHRDYIAAGADVIETNTFLASRFHLAEHYLEHLVTEINRTGAWLAVEARNASGRPVLVAGSIGPLGRPIEPVGAIKRASAERIFAEQIEALVEGGVDLLVFDTFTALHELELAVGVANKVAPNVPVVAQFSFDDEARAADTARALIETLRHRRTAAVGTNCGSGPQAALEIGRRLLEAGAVTVSALPNAGLPHREGGRLVYTAGPDYFAQAARQLIDAGVRIVGGCCGTGPSHIRAMREAIDGSRRAPVVSHSSVRPAAGESGGQAPPASRLASDLEAGRFVVSVELTPPRGIDPRRMLEGARLLQDHGVTYANITDSAMARLRMGVISCAALVQQQTGLEAVAHFTCRDRNVMAIQSELIGAHALGIRNILALRGDPPRVGDYPNATAVWDVNSVGLITILADMNRGRDANGTPIGDGASFNVGAAFNPAAEDISKELRLLRRKIRAGARFIVSNPVYEPAAVARLRDAAQAIGAPIVVGVMPLASARHAEYLHHEVPGITIPDAARRRIEAAGEHAADLGVEMAVEFMDAARAYVRGAYVIPPAGRYDLAARVVDRVREMVG